MDFWKNLLLLIPIWPMTLKVEITGTGIRDLDRTYHTASQAAKAIIFHHSKDSNAAKLDGHIVDPQYSHEIKQELVTAVSVVIDQKIEDLTQARSGY